MEKTPSSKVHEGESQTLCTLQAPKDQDDRKDRVSRCGAHQEDEDRYGYRDSSRESEDTSMYVLHTAFKQLQLHGAVLSLGICAELERTHSESPRTDGLLTQRDGVESTDNLSTVGCGDVPTNIGSQLASKVHREGNWTTST